MIEPFYDGYGQKIYIGTVLDVLRQMPDKSIHCCVTSPPFFGHRSYESGITWNGGDPDCTHRVYDDDTTVCKYCGAEKPDPPVWGGLDTCPHDFETSRYYVNGSPAGTSAEAFSQPGEANAARVKAGRWREDATCSRCNAWRGHLGAEPTVDLYISHLVTIFHEVFRVLRDDGTLWLELGDSFGGSGGAHQEWHENPGKHPAVLGGLAHDGVSFPQKHAVQFRQKQLLLVPHRVAIALGDDGWLLRQTNIWARTSPIPEAVRDRTTTAHSYVFMFAKQGRYFYDVDAVAEPASANTHQRGGGTHRERIEHGNGVKSNDSFHSATNGAVATRNKRSVWTINPEPNAENSEHFAVFPKALVIPPILAGTSEFGACSTCGAPWKRVIAETAFLDPDRRQSKRAMQLAEQVGLTDAHIDAIRGAGLTDAGYAKGTLPAKAITDLAKEAKALLGAYYREFLGTTPTTTGWEPTCQCPDDSLDPCVVLDPFLGSGTTLAVARSLRRHGVGIDLNTTYATHAAERIDAGKDALPVVPSRTGEIVSLHDADLWSS